MFVSLLIDQANQVKIRINVHPNIDISIQDGASLENKCIVEYNGKKIYVEESGYEIEQKINKAIIIEKASVSHELRKHLQDMLI
jgi:hypothetical protein